MLLDLSRSPEELDSIQQAVANPYLSEPARGLQLVARLIGQPRPNAIDAQQRESLAKLHRLIHERFIALASRGSYPGEAQALRELLALEESLENLALFPDLANKTIVGVGGGFSAGKSRFLNTLLGVDLLPESLEPTTAIPSFITRGEADIVALNSFNHRVALDRDALQAITHAFSQHYRASLDESFGFAHALKLLMLHQRDIPWCNLAFLDTPGYSKADAQGASQTDEDIALKQLTEADRVLWLLNAKNGSIRQDDLQFLRTLKHPHPVFFVVTQADLVGHSRIEAILDSTREAIDAAGIPCAGLMAWAAPLGDGLGEPMGGDDIRAWLDDLDRQLKFTTYRQTCERVLDGYIRHNQQGMSGSRQKLVLLNTLLPLAEQLPESERTTLRELIREQRDSQQRFIEQRDAFAELKVEMLDVLAQLVGDLANDAVSSEEIVQQALRHHDQQQYDLAAAGFFKAAEMGHAAAQFNLGLCYAKGLGVTRSDEQAVSWYRKAAEQGHVSAQFNLGACYANGEGVPRDEQQAIGFFQRAADQGNTRAYYSLVELSAHAGDVEAQYEMAMCYEQGSGTDRDIDKAIAWYRQAALKGHPDAQYELGRRYMEGDGVIRHPAAARRWLEKSAAQGNMQAKKLLQVYFRKFYTGVGQFI